MNSKTFCVQPWLSKEYDFARTSPCCWLAEDYDLDIVKQDLLNGVASPACKRCWISEAQGLKSRRQQQNMLADTLYDLSVETIQDTIETLEPSIYQIATSTKCNGMCIMCSHDFSSKWQSVTKKPGPKTVSDEFIDALPYDTIKYLELVGGEPLLEKKNLTILDRLNADCTVSIVTNGTVEMSPTMIRTLDKFKRLIICISIDGIGAVFDYHRWPLQWSSVVKNLEIFKTITEDISISYTRTNVSVVYEEETFAWFEQQGLPYIVNNVEYPAHLNPNNPIDFEKLDYWDNIKGIKRSDYLNEETLRASSVA